MYSTCLFCHRPLGTNEAIEHFPVGRRLAFDAARGRLWVVCRHCQRWNLTPLEERWEAIEECERRFRGTRLRASTDQIGLAKLKEGLELVRIGDPLRPELAAWRYGDQFGRRRTRRIALATLGLGAIGAVLVGGAVAGIGIYGGGWGLTQLGRIAVKGLPQRVVARVPGGHGSVIRIHNYDLERIVLLPAGDDSISLALRQGRYAPPIVIGGARARQALAMLLPALNRYGGTRGQVTDAVAELEAAGGSEPFVQRLASRSGPGRWTAWPGGGRDVTRLAHLPVIDRLALEMALHEEQERRAMEGELAALEAAWKEAEEIAAIADDMFLPPSITDWLARHRP